MVSFMRYCKRISIFLALIVFCTQVLAVSNNVEVRAADLNLVGETYKLDVFAEITLDEKIEEAVNNGVALNFLYEFQLLEPREYWFDHEVVTKTKRITVSYHALSRQYLVNDGTKQTSHEILSEAMIELMQVEAWKVVSQKQIDQDVAYQARLLIRLDKTKLPKALQVDAIASEDWSLVSQRFEWQPSIQGQQ